MIIHKLTMSAFAAYKDKTVIDFENIIDQGLYLISGPTGCGKTTIFDAISFALYGCASGQNRSQSGFRSDFADPQDETYVELEFELSGHYYTIKRCPSYMRPGYKTAKSANAYLTCKDYSLEGIKEVNDKIKELLGIDVHQFKQIVMIAQGEFTKLIYATSEDREKVLRHVFHTEPLVRMEIELKEKTKNYKSDYALSVEKLMTKYSVLNFSKEFMDAHKDGFHPQYIEDAKNENEKYIVEYEEKNKEKELYIQQYLQETNAYNKQDKINQDFERLKDTQNSYQQHLSHEQECEALNQKLKCLRNIVENQSMIDRHQHLLKENQRLTHILDVNKKEKDHVYQKYIEVQKEFDTIDDLRKKKESLVVDIENIKKNIEQQKSYKEVDNRCHEIQRDIENMQEHYAELKKRHSYLSKRVERDQESVNQLPVLELQLKNDEQQVQEINDKRILIHELSELYDHYKETEDLHYDLSSLYQTKDAQYQHVFLRYKQEDENFKRHQAGILALDLVDHQPCPVCGSLEHPCPATLCEHIMSTDELERLHLEVEKCEKEKEDVYRDVLAQNDKMNIERTNILAIKKRLGVEEELSKEIFIQLLSNICETTQVREQRYQENNEQIIYLKKLKKSLKKDCLELEKDQHTLEKEENVIQEKEKILASYNSKKEQILQNGVSPDDNLRELLKQTEGSLLTLEKTIQDIDQRYHHQKQLYYSFIEKIDSFQLEWNENQKSLDQQSLLYQDFIAQYFHSQEHFDTYLEMLPQYRTMENTYQNYIVKKEALHSQVKMLEQQLDGCTYCDLSQAKLKLEEMSITKDNMSNQCRDLYQTIEHNKRMIIDIEKIYQENQKIFHHYTLYQDLADMTSGKNAMRMSFERYVLSAYFEHILQFANMEFLKMTDGRFEMRRKTEVKGAKQQGLDLSVMDYETGIVRDINTLSGGETFKAALSLALGLSSMIQSYAGGIELNTLFIDEGFGSLDHDSINKALSVLMDMKNDHKVIGIISHVDELKERIDAKIIVEKGKQGSILSIEND